MQKWTREEKSQILCEQDEKRLSLLHQQIRQSIWRGQYHVQTVTGLMNDPNGFSKYNGQWHLFYQWFPFGAVHGMKHWYHVVSDDLVHWQNEGLAIKPTTPYENDGCFSGSAYVKDNVLYLVYTGNTKNEEGNMVEYQMLAAMDKEGRIGKDARPIIFPQAGYTGHQRDPHIFYEKGKYHILLGAQNEKREGKLLLFSSRHIRDGWKLMGEMTVEGYPSFGYMCECPDIQKVGRNWVLIFSPQGLHKKGDLTTNSYQSVYFIGDLDLENLRFVPKSEMKLLDYGFDFYAPQCAFQKDYRDKAVLEGWFGCSDCCYPPSDEEGWSGMQTLARLLSIENGKLKQRPVRALKDLRTETVFEAENGTIVTNRLFGRMPMACVIDVENPSGGDIRLNLFAQNRNRGFEISYTAETKTVACDRSEMVHVVNPEYGSRREAVLDEPLSKMEIFVDHSTVEVFINDEVVMSSRIFPTADEHFIRMSGKDINLKISLADTTVNDDFVIFRR